MELCRFSTQTGPHLGLIIDSECYDLTALDPARFRTMGTFLQWTAAVAAPHELLFELCARSRPFSRRAEARSWLKPIDEQEVWAAGVTYQRSVDARERESHGSNLYNRVYLAQRPEIFFKATPHRVVGAGEPVRMRGDSRWTVPEPELALLLNPELDIVGFTIGNDMSARDIEGENALYLPQAKIYRQCCALGPVVSLAGTGLDPTALAIRMTIERHGTIVFEGETNTSQMARSFADLVAYLGRENDFPAGAVLLTGTGLVPPDDFSLADGDVITIEVPGIGALQNPVIHEPTSAA